MVAASRLADGQSEAHGLCVAVGGLGGDDAGSSDEVWWNWIDWAAAMADGGDAGRELRFGLGRRRQGMRCTGPGCVEIWQLRGGADLGRR
ncbi:hypothetical protein M0R45_002369 [Rubus argutus]|uniref:Uncharacterized protein n=1 Tax=Rubus argutus TaxID=59490 RepID=A0AAW1VI32_RUBAR